MDNDFDISRRAAENLKTIIRELITNITEINGVIYQYDANGSTPYSVQGGFLRFCKGRDSQKYELFEITIRDRYISDLDTLLSEIFGCSIMDLKESLQNNNILINVTFQDAEKEVVVINRIKSSYRRSGFII